MSQFFPLKTATELFAQAGPIEKKDLKVGFIPITCATPIIMAHPMGFYSKHGLDVDVVKTAGWAVIRDKMNLGENHGTHMLIGMPLASTMGLAGSPVKPMVIPWLLNRNGQAITLNNKLDESRDLANMVQDALRLAERRVAVGREPLHLHDAGRQQEE